jgi:hypothetical protein
MLTVPCRETCAALAADENTEADVFRANLLPFSKKLCWLGHSAKAQGRKRVSVELARIRLRGIYAAVAGFVLLVGVQVYQAAVLAPTGYVAAINAIDAQHSFGPYLVWLGLHGSENRALRLIEVVIFVLAASMPQQLRRVLWPADPKEGRWAAFLGQIGFALSALVLVLGLFTSTGAAAAYADAPNAAAQAGVARDFATSFAIETLLSRVLGGALLTVFLIVTSTRLLQTRILPVWLAYLGLLTAALLGATAALSTLAPDDPQIPTAGLSFLALAIWLIAVGVLLARLRALPNASSAPAE